MCKTNPTKRDQVEGSDYITWHRISLKQTQTNPSIKEISLLNKFSRQAHIHRGSSKGRVSSSWHV